MTYLADIGLKLVLSCIFGGIIGYERQSRNKSAGLRTHILVALGSCLVMVTGTNLFQNFHGVVNIDPGRLAAQVVSGIGFLGAGTILREGLTVQGLTTAASLWVVAGVGLAIGAGYLVSAGVTTSLAFITLALLPRIERSVSPGRYANITINAAKMPGQIDKVIICLKDLGITSIRDIRVALNNDDTMTISLLAYLPHKDISSKITTALLNIGGIRYVEQELS